MRKVLFILGQLTDSDVEWLSNNGKRTRVARGVELIKYDPAMDLAPYQAAIFVDSQGTTAKEILKKIEDAGFRIAEVPVHHYHRAFGRSQFFNFRRVAKTGIDVMRLWFALVVLRRHQRGANVHQRARDAARSTGVAPRP